MRYLHGFGKRRLYHERKMHDGKLVCAMRVSSSGLLSPAGDLLYQSIGIELRVRVEAHRH